MTDIDVRLREDVHVLGELLGETIRQQHGDAFLQKIEDIRHSAKADRRGPGEQLTSTLPTWPKTICCRWPGLSTSSSTWPIWPNSTS